jgi:DNA-binding MarR family transcriptional regulator
MLLQHRYIDLRLTSLLSLKQRTKYYPLTRLQEKILRILTTHSRVTYKTLMEQTRRDRITLLQSVESLILQGYVEKQKINPEFERSKLVLRPTLMAKHLAWTSLGVDIENILKIEGDQDIFDYFELIKDVSDPLQRQKFIDPLSSIITSYGTWKDKGKIDPKLKRDAIKEGFCNGIVELVKRPKNDVGRFFNQITVEWLKKLFSTAELREFSNLFEIMGNNLIRSSKKIPI